MQTIIDRFIRYVQLDTQSDASSPTTPSTEKQWVLAKLLVKELQEMGMTEVTIDENAYVMATLPSNVDFDTPTIGFLAHF
jgi:tripeptide aminopeptidase